MGISVGCLAAGHLMKYGRKWILILFLLIGIAGETLAVLPHYQLIVLGRAIYGIGAGGMIAVAPRMIQETIPNDMFDKGFSAATNTSIDIFVLFNTLMMTYMPQYPIETKEELKHSHLWRISYFIPLPLMVAALLIALFTMRTDTIGYWVQKKNKEKTIEALKQVYLFEEEENYEKRYNSLLSILDKDPNMFEPETDEEKLKDDADDEEDEVKDKENQAEKAGSSLKDKLAKKKDALKSKASSMAHKDEDDAKQDAKDAKNDAKNQAKKDEKKAKKDEKQDEKKAKKDGKKLGDEILKEGGFIEDDHIIDNVTYNLNTNVK